MHKESNDKIAILMLKVTQENFPHFKACRFDKGFHTAVESDINALQIDRLSKCSDHSIDSIERCAALAVLSRNSNRSERLDEQKKDKGSQK
ncbi:MAG: hypothetical protein RQ733_03370 [Methyloprofundus sp.]|nr:hypothetical protein [Methyloprofundus sp.]